VGTNPVQRIALHRITEQSPVIAQHFAEQVAVIGLQGLRKQGAAVECMFAQHALAPTVDGGDGRFVHPLRGDVQTIGASGPLRRVKLLTQFDNQGIRRRGFFTEKPRGLGQPRTDSFTQFFGGGISERHHKNLRGQQLPAEAARFAAVPKDQPQIKRRDSKGLAGAGTGLDKLTAVQREGQCQRCLGTHARAPSLVSERQGASYRGRYNASHQPENVSSASNASKSAN